MAKRGATKRRGVVSAQMTGIKSGAPGVSWRIQNQLWGREASGHRSNVYRGLCLALAARTFSCLFFGRSNWTPRTGGPGSRGAGTYPLVRGTVLRRSEARGRGGTQWEYG